MKCDYCENRVSAWRVLAGSRFCSRDHQRRFLARSARALRDMEDVYGVQPLASELPLRKTVEPEARRTQPGQVITVLGLVAAGFLVLALLGLPGGGSPALQVAVPDYTLHATPRAGFASGLR